MKRFKLTELSKFFKARLIQANSPVYNGSILDPQSIGSLLAQVSLNGASAAGTLFPSSTSATTTTLTNLGALQKILTAGAAVTVTLDSAYNIGLTLPQPLTVGQTFTFNIATPVASTTVATPTLSDTAVTLAGTTSCVASANRLYQGSITQVYSTVGMQTTVGTTFTSLTQVGSTNNYTVALGTNTLSQTVGQLIYLGVTTGTVPSGWYPINKVTSATSFVIAAPASGTAWTATAATVGTSTVAPATYSPLITITGLLSSTTFTQ